MNINLYLNRPERVDEDGVVSDEANIPLLEKLESSVWSSIMASDGGRSEARLWLCDTVSNIRPPPSPREQLDVFTALLRTSRNRDAISSHLMHVIFEERPDIAGKVLSDHKTDRLRNFFRGNSGRVRRWFASSSGPGGKSLLQFAFVNREIYWDELVWKGKHRQSPVVVATKPHYFNDLDIDRTVNNFIERVPRFWSSKEFARSLKNGEILSLDTDYFIALFLGEEEQLWETVSSFLLVHRFRSLCSRILIVLEERDLLLLLTLIRKHVKICGGGNDFHRPSFWLEFVLSRCDDWCDSIDALLLTNAVITKRRQLTRIIHDDAEDDSVQCTADRLFLDGGSTPVSIARRWGAKRSVQVIKLLGVHSWAVHYSLNNRQNAGTGAWETLFASNSVGFRRSNVFSTLIIDDGNDDRKKRPRSSSGDEFPSLFGDGRNDGVSALSAETWFLSTDGFSFCWGRSDLPEHLSQHAFSTWIRWISS